MMLTRDQAAEVWCPMVRVDRWQSDKQCCIADKCALWRWGETKRTHETRVVDAPDLGVGGKRAIKAPVDVLTRGYCGLAGAPTIGSAS